MWTDWNCLEASKYDDEPVVQMTLVSLALRRARIWSMSQKVKRGDAARAGVATGPDAVPQQKRSAITADR